MAEWQPATPGLRAAILELIGRPVYPYLLTTTRAAHPYSRPVICVNDGFRIRMVTRASAKKVGHLRRNPHAALLWLDGSAQPPRSVLLQGSVCLLEADEAVQAFFRDYARKNPARTRLAAEDVARVVLELRPEFCRADWFAGFTPVILRRDQLESPA